MLGLAAKARGIPRILFGQTASTYIRMRFVLAYAAIAAPLLWAITPQVEEATTLRPHLATLAERAELQPMCSLRESSRQPNWPPSIINNPPDPCSKFFSNTPCFFPEKDTNNMNPTQEDKQPIETAMINAVRACELIMSSFIIHHTLTSDISPTTGEIMTPEKQTNLLRAYASSLALQPSLIAQA